MAEPVSTLLKLDYLGVRARIVVNHHGDRWRATIQRQWRDNGRYGAPEFLLTLTPENHATFPSRQLAITAATLAVIEWEDEQSAASSPPTGDTPEDRES